MTDFIDGYTPGALYGQVRIQTPLDEVSIQLNSANGVYHQELNDAIVAGIAAIKASLETSFSPNTGYTQNSVTGSKSL